MNTKCMRADYQGKVPPRRGGTISEGREIFGGLDRDGAGGGVAELG